LGKSEVVVRLHREYLMDSIRHMVSSSINSRKPKTECCMLSTKYLYGGK